MKSTSKYLFAAVVVANAAFSVAAPADELARLGVTLTPWGAEVSGNKEGTIPAYSGGVSTPPQEYDKKNPGWRPDPFKDDKPLFTIDAKNMDQYADKLSEGVKELMRKYSDFHIVIYPTRRSAAYPEWVQKETIANASRCTLAENNEGLNSECRNGIPFPIPKNGYEAMWNKFARFRGVSVVEDRWAAYVKPNGDVVIPNVSKAYQENGLYNTAKPSWHYFTRIEYLQPARISGMANMYFDSSADNERSAWAYAPATRRVRLSPSTAADTPISTLGGSAVYDEADMFAGKMDRFDFKLVGKKEMFIPYNVYGQQYPEAGSGCDGRAPLQPNFYAPKCVRFELHRVWHVQATLKEGKRHVYSKRDIFLDEDAWYGGIQEAYDAGGKIYRMTMHGIAPLYDIPAPAQDAAIIYDLASGIYTAAKILNPKGVVAVTPMSETLRRPETLNRRMLTN